MKNKTTSLKETILGEQEVENQKSLRNELVKLDKKWTNYVKDHQQNYEQEYNGAVLDVLHDLREILTDDTLLEFSSAGGIGGYLAPLGSNPARSDVKKDKTYEPHLSISDKEKTEDDDNKIRNELALSNTKNYIKKHPINKQKNILGRK